LRSQVGRLRVRRGGVLRNNGRPVASVPPPARTALWRVLLLVLMLPMFAQTFQYLIDVYPLYTLSKIWPLLTLPLFCWGLARLDMPHKALIVTSLGWILGVAPMMSVLQLGNSLPDALSTTVKAWCFTFPLSGAAALVLLRPSPRLLRRVLLGLGVALFAGLMLVWVLVPFSAYDATSDSKLFMYDDERGYHLFMPIFFGLTLLFALNRSFWIRPAFWKLLGVAAGMGLLLTIYKERATIAGAALVLVLGAALSVRRTLRPAAFAILGVLGSFGMLFVLRHLQSPEFNESMGGSLSIRKNSVATALDFLGSDPIRWLFGVGATTRVGDVNLGDLLHNPSFFLADIGWLGIVFEYGLLGSTLFVLLHVAALRLSMRTAQADDPVALAIGDYILYVLLVSPIYSAMFTPGEVMTCMALTWYMSRSSNGVERRVLV
jgi:hypothetical protein